MGRGVRYGRVGQVVVEVRARPASVTRCGWEETGSGRRHRLHVHEVEVVRVVMVAGHQQIRLVLGVGRRVGTGLHGLRQTGKVKLVGVAFTVHFCHDVLVVVISQGPTQLVVVHVGLALPLTPTPGDFVRVDHLELPVGALPGYTISVRAVREELEKELPQLNLTTA